VTSRTLWKAQAPAIDTFPVHFRGEILAGLAQAAQRTGRTDEAAEWVDKMLAMMPNTPYEATARQWKAQPASAASSTVACKSCHEVGRLAAPIERMRER
jgi:hypothetical protein